MKMRPLIIDDHARAEVARVLAYAKDHHYKQGDIPPGLDSNLTLTLSTYRIVFSFTEADGKLFRHMTILVPSDLYPNPASAFMLASLLGFTGYDEDYPNRAPLDWGFRVNEQEHSIVMAQIIQPPKVKRLS